MSMATHQVDEVAEVLLDLLGRQTPHQVEGTVQLLLSLKQRRSHTDGEKDRQLHTTLENQGRLCKCVYADYVKSVVRSWEVGDFKCLYLYTKKSTLKQIQTKKLKEMRKFFIDFIIRTGWHPSPFLFALRTHGQRHVLDQCEVLLLGPTLRSDVQSRKNVLRVHCRDPNQTCEVFFIFVSRHRWDHSVHSFGMEHVYGCN